MAIKHLFSYHQNSNISINSYQSHAKCPHTYICRCILTNQGRLLMCRLFSSSNYHAKGSCKCSFLIGLWYESFIC